MKIRLSQNYAALFAVTVLAFAAAVYGNYYLGYTLPDRATLTNFDFESATVGLAVQEHFLPLILLYIFFQTDLFRRQNFIEVSPSDNLKILGFLSVTQILSLFYIIWIDVLTNEQTTFGYLTVMVGGLLCGWRTGLVLGLITLIFRGTNDLVTDYKTGKLLAEIGSNLANYYFFNFWNSSALWAGTVAGFLGGILQNRKFNPLTAFFIGAGVDFVGGEMIVLTAENPRDVVDSLVQGAVVSGLMMSVVALMIRGAQSEAERRRAQLAELSASKSELQILQAQINPHFILNTLNTVRYFVRENPETARQLLLNLSKVFSHVLRSGDSVALKNEIEYVEAYLALQKARMSERLQIEMQISEPEIIGEKNVPTLILQPLVENAVVHGIAPKTEGGSVKITIEQSGVFLLIAVEDTGNGFDPADLDLTASENGKNSIGLQNIRRRLQLLYGEKHEFEIDSKIGGGTKVRMKIPLERTNE